MDAETVKFIRTLISLAHLVRAKTKIPISPKWGKCKMGELKQSVVEVGETKLD